MISHKLGFVLLSTIALAVHTPTQTQVPSEPYVRATEPGVPFPLPQETAYGRRASEGGANALTFSWDGRLIMYADSGAVWNGVNPSGSFQEGYVFATFDPALITLDAQNRPVFGPAIGTPYPRFAVVSPLATPDTTGLNVYPTFDPVPDPVHYPQGHHYPHIPWTMGELGLREHDVLSNNMYPAPVDPGAFNQNPYPSNASGTPLEFGTYRTYCAYVTFQDLPKFWNRPAGMWQGYTIQPNQQAQWGGYSNYPQPASGPYPNGVTLDQWHPAELMKRNGIAKLQITTNPATHTITQVTVLEKWKPFTVWGGDTQFPALPALAPLVGLGVPTTSTMYADNFEPILTHDGHLMVGKGSPFLVTGSGSARVVFYYNQNAFSDTGWVGPYELTKLFSKNTVSLAGSTIAERYPISRHRLKDYSGQVLQDTDPFEGGYTWLDPDGRFLVYSLETGGVANGFTLDPVGGYPATWLLADGGGTSNRAHTSIVGSVTGWQTWRIDHEAENPNRHMFTAWDPESRTTHLRVASLGFSPGFWNVLGGAQGLPLRDDGHLKLQLINSNRLLYYELDLSAYQERDYGFYLPMTEMLARLPSPSVAHDVDVTRTPDLSGNGHVGIVHGGQLPCEYFDLPTWTSTVSGAGFYYPVAKPSYIWPSWTAADCIMDISGTQYRAKLADWKDGRDADMAPNHQVDTAPFAGAGNPHDMDSDACWGRVGQAMFFKNATYVAVANTGSPAELNPGVLGNARGFTASLWVRPLQSRSADTALFSHNFTITLKADGSIAASLMGTTVTSAANAAPVGAWTHVTLTWKDTAPTSSSTLTLYVNGTMILTAALGFDNLTPSAAEIRVGCLASCATNGSRAVLLLDEVALKNSALLGQDVVNLALGPIPTKTWDPTNLPAGPAPFVDSTDSRVPVTSHYDAGIANLGADLFRDVQLSGSQTLSCASCHDPANAFVDGLGNPAGAGNIRNTQTIYNQRYQVEQFWDSRATDLEHQVGFPIVSPSEMNNTIANVLSYLSGPTGQPLYANRFNTLPFATPGVNETNLRRAIATYERSVTAGNAPADQYSQGNASALSDPQKRGRGLFFGKARCSGCHNGPNFTDGRLWTTGNFRVDGLDDGAYASTAGPGTAGRARFKGAFKTPTLRELTRTAPYFHDGRARFLDAVIDFYDAGGVRQDPQYPGYGLGDAGHDIVAEEINRRLGLTSQEKADLKAYLLALTADVSGSVNNGPIGNNHAPTVTFISATASPTGIVTVVATITDSFEGQADLDPAMNWTLDMLFPTALHYRWSDSSPAPISITNGYQVTITKPGPLSGQIQLRAADRHGKWSGWLAINY